MLPLSAARAPVSLLTLPLSAARPPAAWTENAFIEWATVGGRRYGTSVSGVQAVSASGKVCLLDLDVQGVQALRQRPGLRPYCVWIAPPSLDALRARLRSRGTEDDVEIEQRIARATQEIEFSLSARCFDKIVLNDQLPDAFATLKTALDAQLVRKAPPK